MPRHNSQKTKHEYMNYFYSHPTMVLLPLQSPSFVASFFLDRIVVFFTMPASLFCVQCGNKQSWTLNTLKLTTISLPILCEKKYGNYCKHTGTFFNSNDHSNVRYRFSLLLKRKSSSFFFFCFGYYFFPSFDFCKHTAQISGMNHPATLPPAHFLFQFTPLQILLSLTSL